MQDRLGRIVTMRVSNRDGFKCVEEPVLQFVCGDGLRGAGNIDFDRNSIRVSKKEVERVQRNAMKGATERISRFKGGWPRSNVKWMRRWGWGCVFGLPGQADLTHAGGRTGTPAKPPTKPQARNQHQQESGLHIRFTMPYVSREKYNLNFFIIAPCFEISCADQFFIRSW